MSDSVWPPLRDPRDPSGWALATTTTTWLLTTAWLVTDAVNTVGDVDDLPLGLRVIGPVVVVSALVAGAGWLRRARNNAAALFPWFSPSRGLVWTWAGWVVPVVWWWFPFQIVGDVERATRGSARPRVLRAWWTAFLSMMAIRVAQQYVLAYAGDQFLLRAVLEAGYVAATVSAAVLWTVIVRRLTRAQAAVIAARARTGSA